MVNEKKGGVSYVYITPNRLKGQELQDTKKDSL